MADLYDLIFLGIDPKTTDHNAAIASIAKLLEVDVREIEYLETANISGVVKQAISEEKARRYQTEITRLGGICNRKLAAKPKLEFELASVEIAVAKEPAVFSCPACGYTENVDSKEELPLTCPRCGIAPSKYGKASTAHPDREKMIKKAVLPPAAVQKAQNQTLRDALVSGQQGAEVRTPPPPSVEAEPNLDAPAKPSEWNLVKYFNLATVLPFLLGALIGVIGTSVFYEIVLSRVESQAVTQDGEESPAPLSTEASEPSGLPVSEVPLAPESQPAVEPLAPSSTEAPVSPEFSSEPEPPVEPSSLPPSEPTQPPSKK